VKVAVFGAGGTIGRQIVGEARERGHDVTAVRRADGDVRDPLAVLGDQDAVISAVGSKSDPRIYLDAAKALVAALRAHHARLIVVGGAGSLQAGDGRRLVDTPGFPPEFREEALGQAAALDFYRTVSDVRWTYVSPAAELTPGLRTGRFRTGGDQLLTDDDGRSRITIADFAAAIVDELERPQAIGRRMTVAY